jgi:fibronectin type 3 domain-containing protein
VYIPKSIYGEVHIDSVSASGFERKIKGEFVDYRPKNEITKFVLMRSDSIAFGYQFLAEQTYSTNQFNFTATVPISSGDRYYYKVAAVSPDNDTVYSFPYYFFTLDQIPPSIPIGLHGVVNDSGVVRLAWKLNPENDIRGYRVFWANSLKEEFVEATKVFCTDSVFYDTLSLNNLTSEIYYRIVAVDLNYNNSKNCDPVKLLKPDTIAPVPAVFTDYLSDKKGVYLSWNNSSSKDVVGSMLLRKKENKIDTLIHWSDTTSQYLDSTGISGEKYAYFILTADNSQNKSISSELNVNYETGTRTGVTDISFKVNRELKQIELFWKLPQQEIYSIQIYRAKNEGGFILYKTLRDPKAVSFIDKDLAMNNTYRYKIKVVYKSGVSSVLSEEITATY